MSRAANNREQVTQVLARMGDGHASAAAELLPLVYEELRRLAQARLSKEAPGQTLQPTALVHEAYMRLVDDSGGGRFSNRAHFFASAAEAMRRILVERARHRAAHKHGGGRQRVPLMDVPDQGGWTEPEPDEMLALDDALGRLAQSDRRLSEVVMFRYFAGLTVEQTAEAMDASPATIKRDWNYARAWLFDQVNKGQEE